LRHPDTIDRLIRFREIVGFRTDNRDTHQLTLYAECRVFNFFSFGICGKFCDLNQMQKCMFMLNRITDIKYSGVCYNERCYNERCYNERCYNGRCYNERYYKGRMLHRTVFVNKIRMLQLTQMLQRTWKGTIVRGNTHVPMTCRNFPL